MSTRRECREPGRHVTIGGTRGDLHISKGASAVARGRTEKIEALRKDSSVAILCKRLDMASKFAAARADSGGNLLPSRRSSDLARSKGMNCICRSPKSFGFPLQADQSPSGALFPR
jgi:hypothetical protein